LFQYYYHLVDKHSNLFERKQRNDPMRTFILTPSRLRIHAIIASAMFLACGCGSKVKTAPVAGQVFLVDKPAANATVTFHPVGAAADAPRPTGHVNGDGTFHLTTWTADDGAPVGEYRVTIVRFNTIDTPGQPRRVVNELPERYSNPETSELTATVTKGGTELEPFKLVTH
jgi:hypothetical protein